MATSLAPPGSVANNDTCGTLPVPPRLRDRIVRGEFVQFDDLLLESMSNTVDEPLNLAVIGDGHLRIHRSSTEIKRIVCNLGTWLEAWTVFCRALVDAAVVCAVDFQLKHKSLRVRSPPSTVSHVFLLLLYLRVVTDSQMCMSEWNPQINK